IGAGSRVDAGHVQRSPVVLPSIGGSARGPFDLGVAAGGITELDRLADEAGYGARPGALASAVDTAGSIVAIGNSDTGKPPPVPVGRGRWSLFAAMDEAGVVARSVTSPKLLSDSATAPFGVVTDLVREERAAAAALDIDCSTLVIDEGDLERADQAALVSGAPDNDDWSAALNATDSLVGYLASRLDFSRDLLLIASPTSPWWDPDAHLGIAIARGPGFAPGTTLESASTRRGGYVTLPDIAPTILAHHGIERPPEMDGRPWYANPGPSDRIAAAIESDEEAVFVDNTQSRVSTSFVVFEVLVYLAGLVVLGGYRSRRGTPGTRRAFEIAALAIAAFPAVTYLAGSIRQHSL
ncbi:MAG: hypothetical protein M3290_10120, partial [Actinomycetota bacterium]|nr:hypothetical protein [Actinomycetota bacterium]